MSINFNNFELRPGLVNKEGCLPDPTELVCVEVPKVFDQCLIKRCLTYDEGPDTDTTDCELRSNPLENPQRYIDCRDFNIKLISAEKIPLRGNPDFKKIIIHYMISFYADYIDCDGVNRTELFEVNRRDVIGKFYCPDAIARTAETHGLYPEPNSFGSNILKLEMVAEALEGELKKLPDDTFVLDITLGYYVVVKSELVVQLLIPAYGYCSDIKEPCEEEPEEDPCESFINAPIPKFYPDQNLEPLFPDNMVAEQANEEKKEDE